MKKKVGIQKPVVAAHPSRTTLKAPGLLQHVGLYGQSSVDARIAAATQKQAQINQQLAASVPAGLINPATGGLMPGVTQDQYGAAVNRQAAASWTPAQAAGAAASGYNSATGLTGAAPAASAPVASAPAVGYGQGPTAAPDPAAKAVNQGASPNPSTNPNPYLAYMENIAALSSPTGLTPGAEQSLSRAISGYTGDTFAANVNAHPDEANKAYFAAYDKASAGVTNPTSDQKNQWKSLAEAAEGNTAWDLSNPGVEAAWAAKNPPPSSQSASSATGNYGYSASASGATGNYGYAAPAGSSAGGGGPSVAGTNSGTGGARPASPSTQSPTAAATQPAPANQQPGAVLDHTNPMASAISGQMGSPAPAPAWYANSGLKG